MNKSEQRRLVNEYQRKIWDASQYIGEELYIKVVDQSTGGFGHINVDDFNVPVKVQNSLSFELGTGERQVLFPATLAANDGKNALKIKHADVELEVPAEVLKELQALVATEDLKGVQISFELDTLSAEQVKVLTRSG